MSKQYIKINLNQVVSRFQIEEMKINRNRTYVASGIIACFVCLFSFMSYTNYSTNNLIDLREKEIQQLNEKIDALKKSKGAGELDISEKDIENLYNFELERTYWTPKLQALANLTPVEMAIEELEFDKKTLELTFIKRKEKDVKSFAIVETMTSKFENDSIFNANFDEVRFAGETTKKIQNQTSKMYEFFIDIKDMSKKKKKRKKKK